MLTSIVFCFFFFVLFFFVRVLSYDQTLMPRSRRLALRPALPHLRPTQILTISLRYSLRQAA